MFSDSCSRFLLHWKQTAEQTSHYISANMMYFTVLHVTWIESHLLSALTNQVTWEIMGRLQDSVSTKCPTFSLIDRCILSLCLNNTHDLHWWKSQDIVGHFYKELHYTIFSSWYSNILLLGHIGCCFFVWQDVLLGLGLNYTLEFWEFLHQ